MRIDHAPNAFLGLQPDPGYELTEYVGSGKIGLVYKGVRKDPQDTLAYKIIPEGRLKPGWERELAKLAALRRVEGVVQYHRHGASHDTQHRPFTWVCYDFIPGRNLRDHLSKPHWPLDLAFIEDLALTLLRVLHACGHPGIQHGDLHDGNILIADPDPRYTHARPTVWVADFGYGGSHNNVQPKDDYRQFFSIIRRLLNQLAPAELTASDRLLREYMKTFLDKVALEHDATQGRLFHAPNAWISELTTLKQRAIRESTLGATAPELQNPADYTSAEALGNRVDEWQALFVPKFLGAPALLARDVHVLTGARGCGKTMVFRRLTTFMDQLIGKHSGVPGAEQFHGFYLNCRDLVEAFPWVPSRLPPPAQAQLIHFFHLAWTAEILRTVAIHPRKPTDGFAWLDTFLTQTFPSYNLLPISADILAHARSFVEAAKEDCRVTPLGQRAESAWVLSRLDYLPRLQEAAAAHLPWVGEKPFFLFLDDYTMPTVPRNVQRVLNSVVFARRSNVFFKTSTESTNSLELTDHRGKNLERKHDFELIDLATESIHQPTPSKLAFLERVFRPRIDRHRLLRGRKVGLAQLLGKTAQSNNALAWAMRSKVQEGQGQRITYHGHKAFAGIWTSDVRSLIHIFTAMLDECVGDVLLISVRREAYHSGCQCRGIKLNPGRDGAHSLRRSQ